MTTYKLKSRDAVFSFLIITRSRGAAPISWPATPLNRRHSWCGPFIPAKDLFVSLNVLIGEEFTTSWTHSKRLAYQVTSSSDQILRKPSFKYCFQFGELIIRSVKCDSVKYKYTFYSEILPPS